MGYLSPVGVPVRRLNRSVDLRASCLVAAACLTTVACPFDRDDAKIIRLISELKPEWVAEFPHIEPAPQHDIEVISLMGLAWRVEDYVSDDLSGPSPVYGGSTRSVYHTAPPSLAIHAIVPSSACLVSPLIRIQPDANYTLIGEVRTEDLVASGPLRGTFFLEEFSEQGVVQHAFPNRDGSTGGWEREVFAFRTGSEADRVQVSACLAGPGGGTGSVWFDDIALVRHDGQSLASELVDSLVDDVLSFQWRYDVAESIRPDLGRDATWGDETNTIAVKRKIDLGGEVLSALVAPAPTQYRFPVDLQPGARLRVAFGIPNPDGVEIPGSVSFSVRFEQAEREPIMLLERELRLTNPEDPNRWHYVELDLPFTGPGHILLATDATPKLRFAAASFGNPVILPPPTGKKGRRVILISLDTLRADRLGIYGAELPTSPGLDALAARGVLFENAHAPSPWTLPSHRTLLTGLYPLTHGALRGDHHSPRSEITTLGEILQAEGFSTVGIHGGGFVDAPYGFAEGFDRYRKIENLDEAVDAAVDELISHASDDLFLFFHSYQIHSPYREEEDDLAALGARYFELRRRLKDAIRPDELGSHEYLSRHNFSREPLPPDQLEMVKLLYDGGVRSADRRLSRLFCALDDAGLLEEALIVVTSDHGEGFGEHGLLLHANSLYGELLHVPLIIVGSDVPAGVHVEQHVSSADIVPTLLDLLGIEAGVELDGRSLVSLWKDSGAPSELILGSQVLENTALLSSLIDGSKYIVSSSSQQEELYDLRRDALETTNIAIQQPALLEVHRRQMLPRIARLQGLHVVVIGEDVTRRLEGNLTFTVPPGRFGTFFVECETCIQAEKQRLAVSLPLHPGPQWIYLPRVRDLSEVRLELTIGGQPAEPMDQNELLGADPSHGLYAFVTRDDATAETVLSPDQIEQLEALGYLE